jgi:hypothetical protein
MTHARAALQEHVHRAFSGRKPDEVLPYFNYVRSNYEIAASGLFKWVFTAIASVIVFQLLTLAAIKDASFGPVTLQNLGSRPEGAAGLYRILHVQIRGLRRDVEDVRQGTSGVSRRDRAEAHRERLGEVCATSTRPSL